MSQQFTLFAALLASLLALGPACAETIVASWYGPGFHGRLTASGCLYDMYGLSAASRTLPLGTVLDVRYDGAAARVVINDRGPYVARRGLDLSYGAAERLGMLDIGVAPVQVRVVGFSQPCARRRAIFSKGRTG